MTSLRSHRRRRHLRCRRCSRLRRRRHRRSPLRDLLNNLEVRRSLIFPVAEALLRAARLVGTAAVMSAAGRHHTKGRRRRRRRRSSSRHRLPPPPLSPEPPRWRFINEAKKLTLHRRSLLLPRSATTMWSPASGCRSLPPPLIILPPPRRVRGCIKAFPPIFSRVKKKEKPQVPRHAHLLLP